MTTWDEMWAEAFSAEVADQQSKTDTNPLNWRRGGRVSKANPNKEDGEWWDENGKRMFFDFINAYRESGLDIWTTPQGLPGVELGFNNIKYKPFEIDIDLAKPVNRMGTYTEKLENGHRIQISGPLLMPWYFVGGER